MTAMTTVTPFDTHERRLWAGRAEAYSRSFAGLCAYPAAEDRQTLTRLLTRLLTHHQRA
jgi:hypothetical protein